MIYLSAALVYVYGIGAVLVFNYAEDALQSRTRLDRFVAWLIAIFWVPVLTVATPLIVIKHWRKP